jgi:hypothetical protein
MCGVCYLVRARYSIDSQNATYRVSKRILRIVNEIQAGSGTIVDARRRIAAAE